jgi:putative DNA primase/helicase
VLGDIPEHERNLTLLSFGGSMRRRGMSYAAIEAALLVENSDRCKPPLDEAEVVKIAASVARYQPGVPENSGWVSHVRVRVA